ncbi:hypothetical protein QW060_01845 [Myroides ceti]|uniref:Uncharacterized protein n=1 Tax=Paenimyroides ceti TaxID=395087 RepID=A0ABT8CNX6_9FLAO|nr:hypothetical protein [Paenimyroides ceti]MDN3705866.1 hypothetical protein [Paenimyroides ceti]
MTKAKQYLFTKVFINDFKDLLQKVIKSTLKDIFKKQLDCNYFFKLHV